MTPAGKAQKHASLQITRFDAIDSTSLHARRLVESWRDPSHVTTDPRLFVARSQTAGRGQRGRAWTSPGGGLWATFFLPWTPPMCSGALVGPYTLTLGLRLGFACLRTIQARLAAVQPPPDVRLKLPNDVYVGGRKVLGILTEIVRVPCAHHPDCPVRDVLLVGVGVNANVDLAAMPPELARSATSLAHILGSPVDVDALEACLAEHVMRALEVEPLSDVLLADLNGSLYALGQDVVIRPLPDSSGGSSDGDSRRESAVVGKLVGVDPAGLIVVREGDRLVRGMLASSPLTPTLDPPK